MKEIIRSAEGIRTVTLPETVRTVRQEAFYCIKSLLSAVLNENLEELGTEEHPQTGMMYDGVFQ